MTPDAEIIYVGDPMCSWCWGIAPELDELRRQLAHLPFLVITGGLRPGPDAQPMTDQLAGFLGPEWSKVEQSTGQPFDHRLLARRDWLYDTEPACRAVAIMRTLEAPLAWPLFKRIQRAFYAEGILPTVPDAFPSLVSDIGGDPKTFMTAFTGEEHKHAAWADFSLARDWGITSFPAVLARVGDQGHLLTVGYTTASVMLGRLPPELA